MNPGFIAGIFLIMDFEDYKWISLIVLTITEICFICLLNTIMLSAALLLSSSVASHSSSSCNSIGHLRRVSQNAANPLIRINL
jgi:hypothetical protein